MDCHLKKRGMEVEEEDASTWEYEDGGKKLKACERKERQDIEAIFIDSTSVGFFPLLCNTTPTQGSGKYRILMSILCIVLLQKQGGDLYCTDLMS